MSGYLEPYRGPSQGRVHEAIVAAIEAERAHADVLRKRCARLTKALLAAKEKLDKAEAKWNAEWA